MAEVKKIPLRSEIAKEDTWATEDMFATDAAWEEELARVQKEQKELASYAGRLTESPETLLAYLTRMEKTMAALELLGNYCERKSDEDTRNGTYQAMEGKFMGVAVAVDAACSFETPEIMALSDEDMEKFYAACPDLQRYRRYLNDKRRRKAHILSAGEEKLLAAAGEMAQAPGNTYSEIGRAHV